MSISVRDFTIQSGDELLAADRIEVDGYATCLVLHGAGTSDRSRWRLLRMALAERGVGTLAIDFSGHGQSSARTPNSLAKRYREARDALAYIDESGPRSVIGSSMSGEIAVRIATAPECRIDNLVTLVGAAYDPAAFDVPFGPSFTRILREPLSWRRSVVFDRIGNYRGAVTAIRAQFDEIVPAAIGELLACRAINARSAELVDLPGIGHHVGRALDSRAELVVQLADLLLPAMTQR